MTKEEINQEIERRNDIFRKASTSEKRILIIQDALEQLHKGCYFATRMFYTFFPDSLWVRLSKIHGKKNVKGLSIQPALLNDPSCYCCAFGALLVSTIRYQNQVFLGDVGRSIPFKKVDDNDTGILDVFSKEQMKFVEQVYEGFDTNDKYLNDKIDELHEQYPESQSRMIAIFENMLRNNGELIL
jgi:hypothetical protein